MLNKISLANMSVGKRLFLGFGLVLTLTAGIGLVGWHYTRSMAGEFDNLYTENLQSAVHLSNAERGLWELRFGIANYTAWSASRSRPDSRRRIQVDAPNR